MGSSVVNAFTSVVRPWGAQGPPPPSHPAPRPPADRDVSGPYPPGSTICFYNRGEPYYEFTNFWMAPLWLDGADWPSTEHYFQVRLGPNRVYGVCMRHQVTGVCIL
jgi:hypothetical protein